MNHDTTTSATPMNPKDQHQQATTTIMTNMFTENNSTLTIVGAVSIVALTACLFCPAKLLRWVERKRYQYEVTFSLYMMTPTEKFIFSMSFSLFFYPISSSLHPCSSLSQ